MKNLVFVNENGKLIKRTCSSDLSEFTQLQKKKLLSGEEIFAGWDENNHPLYIKIDQQKMSLRDLMVAVRHQRFEAAN